MSLSRCGRRYATFDEAYRAAEARSAKGAGPQKVVSCQFGDHWHTVHPGVVIGQQKRYRPDPFPPVIARLLIRRDEACQRCGDTGQLYKHHRRAKASGGSKARSHTQCACNGILFCFRCHRWVHDHPAAARDKGWIVSQSVNRPGSMQVLRYLGTGEFGEPIYDPQWATCDGRWVHSAREAEEQCLTVR